MVLRLSFRRGRPGVTRAGARPAAAVARPEVVGGELVRDPQCGTYVPKARALTVGTGEKILYFCSAACRDAYSVGSRPDPDSDR
jgi:hypothetical protein